MNVVAEEASKEPAPAAAKIIPATRSCDFEIQKLTWTPVPKIKIEMDPTTKFPPEKSVKLGPAIFNFISSTGNKNEKSSTAETDAVATHIYEYYYPELASLQIVQPQDASHRNPKDLYLLVQPYFAPNGYYTKRIDGEAYQLGQDQGFNLILPTGFDEAHQMALHSLARLITSSGDYESVILFSYRMQQESRFDFLSRNLPLRGVLSTDLEPEMTRLSLSDFLKLPGRAYYRSSKERFGIFQETFAPPEQKPLSGLNIWRYQSPRSHDFFVLEINNDRNFSFQFIFKAALNKSK